LNDINQEIFVTRPALPPLIELIPSLELIWNNRILTNNGPFHADLEAGLCEYLGVKHVSLFANATIALVTAMKALAIKGEVITTPFSFVATSHALMWNGITPVFVDIDEKTLNIDPGKIESAITPRTTAILPVHCYGNPCDVDAIDMIAKKHGLKVVYDAAHAFGVDCHCGSVLNHGDMSVLSFHATKVFNTFEGGAIVSRDAETKAHINYLKNFGYEDEVTVKSVGINGKLSEFNSALGLLQLKYVDDFISQRKKVFETYTDLLSKTPGITVVGPFSQTKHNYSYFPILTTEHYALSRDDLYSKLKSAGINCRRYFYPLISEFPTYRGLPSSERSTLPVAFRKSMQILCLPIYPDLEYSAIERICKIITEI
jgi:dTDP-4-amino-4,6-dideoxygalactose transaminase